MSNQRTIPRKDADFNTAQEVIISMARANQVAWNLDSDWIDNDLMPAVEQWQAAWADYQNPNTRTPLITFVKRKKRTALEVLLGQLIRILQSNPRVTEDDLRAMGIAIRPDHPTPVGVPTTFPECEVDTSLLRHLILHFRDSGSESRGKPAGVHGAEIGWGIMENAPESISLLPHSSFDTHTPFELEFEEFERGKKVWFALRWENTKGEKGPWSEIFNAVIP
jgi:hypothetical protein